MEPDREVRERDGKEFAQKTLSEIDTMTLSFCQEWLKIAFGLWEEKQL